ncbi:hypothetical protein C7457_0823 [Thermovibrio guaymasensis]|uniref:Uncharacterized protein n=1 Tax=Thermovibrio guaymasensis TaxID=240167 RepID=A0A420W9H0_9BACT|nr:hypothetical protein [Thermovibrio guaymasensis]RKQ63934.1 hypothetical protein C7457_0823 [Thermovibrio guaymasensis]
MSDEFFRELMADALGKDPEELGKILGEPQKICDVFVQRVYLDQELKHFEWGVSVLRFNGDELEESATYAIFHSWNLARKYGRALKEFFESRGYETHLKGELGD